MGTFMVGIVSWELDRSQTSSVHFFFKLTDSQPLPISPQNLTPQDMLAEFER